MSGKSTGIRGLTPAVREQLGRYVYRLIDPRGGALRSPDGFAPRPLAATTRTVIQIEELTP